MPNRAAELRQEIANKRPTAVLKDVGRNWMRHHVGQAPDGRMRYLYSGSLGSLHFQNRAGEWKDVDDDLIEDSGQYVRKTKQAPYLLRVANNGRRRVYPDPEDESRYIEFGGMASVGLPSFVGNSMHWESPQHFEVDVTPQGSRVKLDIKVKEQGAPHRYTFTMRLVGLRRWGRFIFPDDGEEAVLEIVQPVAIDAVGNEKDASLEFTGVAVHITVDPAYMRYPITIDPPVERSVNASLNDVSGSNTPVSAIYKTTTSGYMGKTTSTRHQTCRFEDVQVPQGAAVAFAYIQFTSKQYGSGSGTDWKVSLADEDDADQIASVANWLARPHTSYANWHDVPTWSGEEESDDTQSPDISTQVGEVITDRGGWVPGNALLVFVEDDGSPSYRNRVSYTYDSAPSKTADLYIEYEEAAQTGEAVLDGEGALVADGAVQIIALASISGAGAVAVEGSVGTLHTGQIDISGAGALTAIGSLLVISSTINMEGEGALTVLGVFDALACAAAISGEGALVAAASIGAVKEGQVAISGVGGLTADALLSIGAVAAISGDGALTVIGTFNPATGLVSMSGEGSLTAAAQAAVTIYSRFGKVYWEINPDNYPENTTFEFVAILRASAGVTARSRLYNLTADIEMGASEVTTTATVATRVISAPFSLTAGDNIYRAEYGVDAGGTATIYGVALRVHGEPN